MRKPREAIEIKNLKRQSQIQFYFDSVMLSFREIHNLFYEFISLNCNVNCVVANDRVV